MGERWRLDFGPADRRRRFPRALLRRLHSAARLAGVTRWQVSVLSLGVPGRVFSLPLRWLSPPKLAHTLVSVMPKWWADEHLLYGRPGRPQEAGSPSETVTPPALAVTAGNQRQTGTGRRPARRYRKATDKTRIAALRRLATTTPDGKVGVREGARALGVSTTAARRLLHITGLYRGES